MVKRYRGGVVSATEVETTAQSSSGMFNVTEAAQEKQAGTWPGPNTTSVQVIHNTSPYLSGYKFSSQTGFGTKYANVSAVGTGLLRGVDYSADGNMVMVAQNSSVVGSRRITAITWNGEGGYGTFYINPTSVETGFTSYPPLWAKMSRATNHVIYINANSSATNTSRYMSWTPGVGWGTAATLGTSINTNHVAITPYYLVHSMSSTYYYKGMNWSSGGPNGTGMWAWTSTEYGLTSSTSTAFEGSPDGNVFVIANTNTTPGLHAYNMTGTTNGRPNFKYAGPGTGTFITPNSGTVEWSANSDIIAIGGSSNSYLEFYRWNKSPLTVGWGTKLSSPASFPGDYVKAIRWTPDQGAILIGSSLLEAYVWSNSTGIGTKFSSPSTAVGGNAPGLTCELAVSPT